VADAKHAQRAGNANTYIVKPEDQAQGRGIYLLRDYKELSNKDHCVVQKYLTKPHLIDGYKYDLRLYVFVNGITPLRVYYYRDGLARFATEPYEKPSEKNLNRLFMHLTNYSINKESENYRQGTGEDGGGSKRSWRSVLSIIEKEYGALKTGQLQEKIKEIIIKSICMVQPHISHLCRASQADFDLENMMCFQILGFDIMLK
jgi:tubulin polyglutamylase TTLL6/13